MTTAIFGGGDGPIVRVEDDGRAVLRQDGTDVMTFASLADCEAYFALVVEMCRAARGAT